MYCCRNAEKKGVSILYNEHVQEVIQKKDRFIVNTRTNVYSSKALVIAVGGNPIHLPVQQGMVINWLPAWAIP